MQLHRFYLPAADCREDLLRLAGQEARHALRVLRLQQGSPAIVLDGAGTEFHCEVEDTSRDSLSMRVIKKNFAPEPPSSVTLFVGIPKGKIIDNIIQKSVELGARRIVPLLTERVVTRLDEEGAEHKREHWQQTAIEAMKQCGAPRLPEIGPPTIIADVLAHGEHFDLQIVGSLQKDRRHPREVFAEFEKKHNAPPRSAAAWIGPEGDFTAEELKAIEKAGAQPVTFGNLVLRVETAAIYCLSILNYEFNSSGSGNTFEFQNEDYKNAK